MITYQSFEYYFPHRLKETLDERGYDGKDLEDMGVISQSSIRSYLDGNVVPNLKTAIKLAEFLDVSLDYLCGINEDIGWSIPSMQEQLKAPWL